MDRFSIQCLSTPFTVICGDQLKQSSCQVHGGGIYCFLHFSCEGKAVKINSCTKQYRCIEFIEWLELCECANSGNN